MSLLNDLTTQVAEIFKSQWTTRDGTVVPETEDVQLGNDAIKLDAVVLYTDLVASTQLVSGFKDFFAAEVYKSYLLAASRVITACGGSITAFDGDRVMGVFIGANKNSAAAKCALQINSAVQDIVNPALKKQYPDTSYKIEHTTGVDSSPLFVARTGIRGSNDLVWVGRAANYAAKLCTIRQLGYRSFITEAVYKMLSAESKFGGNPKQEMWTKLMWPEESVLIYGSAWKWPLS